MFENSPMEVNRSDPLAFITYRFPCSGLVAFLGSKNGWLRLRPVAVSNAMVCPVALVQTGKLQEAFQLKHYSSSRES